MERSNGSRMARIPRGTSSWSGAGSHTAHNSATEIERAERRSCGMVLHDSSSEVGATVGLWTGLVQIIAMTSEV